MVLDLRNGMYYNPFERSQGWKPDLTKLYVTQTKELKMAKLEQNIQCEAGQDREHANNPNQYFQNSETFGAIRKMTESLQDPVSEIDLDDLVQWIPEIEKPAANFHRIAGSRTIFCFCTCSKRPERWTQTFGCGGRLMISIKGSGKSKPAHGTRHRGFRT